MKVWLALALLLATVRVAHADVFAFKDLEGFEKCMQLDHLIEKVNTADGSQTRLLDPAEIQQRCIAAAVKLLSASKNKDLMMDFVKAAKRLSAPENAVDLTGVLIDTSIAACNDIAAYEVFTRALSYPRDNTFYLPRVRSVVKRCLRAVKNKDDYYLVKHIADSVTDGAPGYCTDAASKKAVCQMKSLVLAKATEAKFTFKGGKGTATTDGQAHTSFDMMTRELDK